MATEIRVTTVYFIVSFLWILFSDQFVNFLLPETPASTTLQTLKGWAFVFATTLMLFVLLRRELQSRLISEARFRQLFRSNPLPTYIYERATLQILDANEIALARYGCSRAEFLSKKITDIRPPEEVPKLLEWLSLSKHTWEIFETRHLYKNGQIVDVEVYPHEIEFEGKAAVLVVVVDVTERKRSERDLLEKDRLRVALDQEMELRKARERFTAMISHEIRTPLTIISTSIDLLENYDHRMSVTDKHRHLEKMDIQVQRINELLSEALSFWRLESVGMDVQAVTINLTHFVKDLIDETLSASKNSHQFVFSAHESPLHVSGDPKLLRFAMMNLLQNAVKYSPRESVISVTLEQRAEYAILQIHDEGIGIPPADREKIFDPFYRAGNVGATPGTGLGLVIARQAVELHQGTLHLDGDEQNGTTFCLRLLLAKQTS